MFKPRKICQAVSYFDKAELKASKNKSAKSVENYMSAETVAGGMWLGEGSKHLGIYGQPILAGEIARLANGLHPKTGDEMVKMAKQKKGSKEPPWVFMDGTFSAPKDYSVLKNLDIGNEKKYVNGFKKAKLEGLKAIEEGLYTRLTKNKKTRNVDGVGAIIASFDHELSRPTDEGTSVIRPDMQMHAHNLFFKHGVLDGKFVSIENFQMLNYQRVYGTKFRASLANTLRDMGFSVVKRSDFAEEVTYKNGSEVVKKAKVNSFAVKGFTDEMRQMFSKRNKEIEYLAKQKGFSDNQIAKDWIAQNNKVKKGNYTQEELMDIWSRDAESVGLNQKAINSMKYFDKMHMLSAVQVEEKLLKRIVKTDKKTGEPVVYEKNALLVLLEYEQLTGMKTEHLLEKWKVDGTLVKNGRFKFKCTKDLTKAVEIQKKWTNKVNVNKSEAFKAFSFSMVQTSVSLSSYLTLGAIAFGIPGLDWKQPDLPVAAKKSGPRNQKTFDQILIGDHTATSIEGILRSIGALSAKLTSEGLTEQQRISIRLQIEALNAKIVELRKKQINTPYSKKIKLN